MKVLLYWEGAVLIARLSEVSISDTHRDAFEVIAETEPRDVVLDCSQVRFISSQGIANLVQLIQHIRRHGGGVQLAGVAPPVERVLEMVNLSQWVPFCGTVREAVAAAGAKPVA